MAAEPVAADLCNVQVTVDTAALSGSASCWSTKDRKILSSIFPRQQQSCARHNARPGPPPAPLAQMPLPETSSSAPHQDLHQQKMHRADKWPQVTSLQAEDKQSLLGVGCEPEARNRAQAAMHRVASSSLLLETKQKTHRATGQSLRAASTDAVAPWPCRGIGQRPCLSPSLLLPVPSAGEGALRGHWCGMSVGPVQSCGQWDHRQCPSHREKAPRASPWEEGQPALSALAAGDLLSTAAAQLQVQELPERCRPTDTP